MLGGWSIEIDGRPTRLGPNKRAVVQALLLSVNGSADLEHLREVLPDASTLSSSKCARLLTITLNKLRSEQDLDISIGTDPVVLHRSSNLQVDLWDFQDHVRDARFDEAMNLIAGRVELIPDPEAEDEWPWREALERFAEEKQQVIAAVQASSGRIRKMRDTRERLLGKTLIPGVGRPMLIGDARARLESLLFPWHPLTPGDAPDGPLALHMRNLLQADGLVPPHLILVGPHGSGKTLHAIATYLLLTDSLDEDPQSHLQRTVVYLDALEEGSEPGFGGDEWFGRRLEEMDAVQAGRPIVIVAHADTFLSRVANLEGHKLEEILNQRMFRDCDVLLCCGEQFYKTLSYIRYATHAFHLDPWKAEQRRAFAKEVFGTRTQRNLERWLARDSSGTRAQLCKVPLHLPLILSLIEEGDRRALRSISTHWHLFDQVARMRLGVAGHLEVDGRLAELAEVAHHFYTASAPAERPVGFNMQDLRSFLANRASGDGASHADELVGQTFLTVPESGSDEIRFEESSWGWFFVARHLASLLTHEAQDQRDMPILKGFSKFFSAGIMEMCEEMLRDKLELYGELITQSLQQALLDNGSTIRHGPRRVAREQVGYLLGLLGDREAQNELGLLLDNASESPELDPLVRRGIVYGLANAGRSAYADAYVEELRNERLSGDTTPARDANIAFLLSFRGDQPFNLENPSEIADKPNPVATIADLVRGLSQDRHAAAWRIKLFTLVDLGTHPKTESTFKGVVDPHREDLWRIIRRLAADPERRGWPEIKELRKLLPSRAAGQ